MAQTIIAIQHAFGGGVGEPLIFRRMMMDGARLFRESRRNRYGGGDRANRGDELTTFHFMSPY